MCQVADATTIGGQHNCAKSGSLDDVRRLGFVMMELMDGFVKDDNTVGVEWPKRWSSDALSFLSATTSVSSARELLQVRGNPSCIMQCF